MLTYVELNQQGTVEIAHGKAQDSLSATTNNLEHTANYAILGA